MMGEYTLIDNLTNERYELEHEDMADIQCALDNYLKYLHRKDGMPNVECMPETQAKISKVRVSMTDY
jgi:hypothetical protein